MQKHSHIISFALIVILISLGGCANFKNIWEAVLESVPKEKKTFTVMSFNIRVGYGAEDPGIDPYTLSFRKKNLHAIVAAIQSVDADIVGLQEVNGVEQARELAQALNMYFAYNGHGAGSAQPSWWGVALLSKYPIQRANGIQISSGSRGSTRNALICTVDLDGQPTAFFNIHKDKNLNDGSSLEVIMSAVDTIEGPIALIGDLNMQPHEWRLDLLKRRFIDTARAVDTKGARNAINTGTFLGLGRIDYVFVDPHYFIVQDAGIVSRAHWHASDHLAYYAQIALKYQNRPWEKTEN